MASRPDVISVETHGAAYLNPHLDDIEAWMHENGYAVFFRDKSDSVYVRPDAIVLTLSDKLALGWKDLTLALRRFRKRLFSRGST